MFCTLMADKKVKARARCYNMNLRSFFGRNMSYWFEQHVMMMSLSFYHCPVLLYFHH